MNKLHHWLPLRWRQALRQQWLSIEARRLTPRNISAMVRVKNEAVFLAPAVESIVDLVEEIVLVDNASTDATPTIVAELARRYRGKIRVFHYPHEIARVGAENHALTQTPDGRRSPRLLSNYYNWCLEQCRMNYVLKWDGDMIASPAFASHVAEFRRRQCLFMLVYGANLHPDRRHLVCAGAEREEEIQHKMPARMTASNWISPYTDPEQRLFPRKGSAYKNDFWWCESLSSRYSLWADSTSYYPPECGYLHLKYCKPDPYENFSPDFESLMKSGVTAGAEVPGELRPLVARVFGDAISHA